MIKKVLFSHISINSFTLNFSLLLLRFQFGIFMVWLHALKKLPPSGNFIHAVEQMGLPYPFFLSWCASLSELIGGIFLILGFITRPSAFFISITLAVAAFLKHQNDVIERKELALIYLGIYVFFTLVGPGKYSLDNHLK